MLCRQTVWMCEYQYTWGCRQCRKEKTAKKLCRVSAICCCTISLPMRRQMRAIRLRVLRQRAVRDCTPLGKLGKNKMEVMMYLWSCSDEQMINTFVDITYKNSNCAKTIVVNYTLFFNSFLFLWITKSSLKRLVSIIPRFTGLRNWSFKRTLDSNMITTLWSKVRAKSFDEIKFKTKSKSLITKCMTCYWLWHF